MPQKLSGNTRGLPPSQIRKALKLFNRRIARDEIVTLEFARELYEAAQELGRRIGVLITREGDVVEVFLGTREILYVPDLGRYRLGEGRLRRLRMVYSDLSRTPRPGVLPTDIYGDLERLRFDVVAAVRSERNKTSMTFAYNLPYAGRGEPVRTEHVADLALFEFDFARFIEELEGEHAALRRTAAVVKDSAVLVGVYPKNRSDARASMDELKELARTAGVQVADTIIQMRDPDPKTLLGRGKLEEVILNCLRVGAEIVIFDTELRPSQWRAITNSTDLKVLDRSMLILDIFAQHAKSSDGRLQVELAQLKYNLPRLVEKDAGLSRLTGGIGGRGPGETKLEIGRRRIRDRIGDLEKRIDKLSQQRSLRRSRRIEQGLPLVAVLGYTNVGKSTLFNKLTSSAVLAESKLFATLDPAQRRLFLPSGNDGSERPGRHIVLSDTVGFIRDLPEELKSAFRATLEEIQEAELLLHVLDASDPEIAERKRAVESVLEEMGLMQLPQVVLLNKCDLVSEDDALLLEREYGGLAVSGLTGRGLPRVVEMLAERLVGRSAGRVTKPGDAPLE